MTSVPQASFAGGELAPGLYGRVDLARYQTSLKTCRNFIVQPYGGVKNRPGTTMCYEVRDSTKRVRLIPFQFNLDQTYVLEFGDHYMRVFQNGGLAVDLGTISAWSTNTVYAKGDKRTNGGSTYYCDIAHTSGPAAGDFATALAAGYWFLLTPLSGGVVVEIPTPYTYTDLPDLKYTQSADVITIVHPSYAPRNLGRYSNEDWRLAEFAHHDGPWLAENIDIGWTMTADKTTGITTVHASKNTFVSTDEGRLLRIEQKDFGTPWEVNKTIVAGEIRRSDGKYYRAASSGTTGTLRPTHQSDVWSDGGVNWVYLHNGWGVCKIIGYTDAKTVDVAIEGYLPDPVVLGGSLGSSYSASSISGSTLAFGGGVLPALTVGNAVSVEVTMVYTGFSTSPIDADGYGGGVQYYPNLTSVYRTIATVIDATHLLLQALPSDYSTWTSTSVKIVSTSGMDNSATYKWRLSAWYKNNFPSCVGYFQQRQVFASTPAQPQTLWFSKTSDFTNFGESSPIADDDAITFSLASPRIDTIKGILPMESLVILTRGGEWIVSTGQDDVVKPTNIGVKAQGYRGSGDLPPLVIGDGAVFCQDKGQVVRDLGYEFARNQYTGNDLTVMAAHLVEGRQIEEWSYQQNPTQCIWMIRDDGTLLGMTYMREQQVIGWHRHDTDGTFESVCVVSEANEDRIYVAVKRTINGVTKRYVERFYSRLASTVATSVFLDCAAVRVNAPVTVKITVGRYGSPTFEHPTSVYADGAFGPSDVGRTFTLTCPSYPNMEGKTWTVSSFFAGAISDGLNRDPAYGGPFDGTLSWDGVASKTQTGLSSLEGKQVYALVDGVLEGPHTVTSGSITLTNTPVDVVIIGLLYTSDLETLDVSTLGQEPVRDKRKIIPKVSVLVETAKTLYAGKDASNLSPASVVYSDNYDSGTGRVTGIAECYLAADWGKQGRVFIRNTDPNPMSILGVIPDVIVGG